MGSIESTNGDNAPIQEKQIMKITKIDAIDIHDGTYKTFHVDSKACNTKMRFGIFIPSSVIIDESLTGKYPAIWWLHGSTCTDTIFPLF